MRLKSVIQTFVALISLTFYASAQTLFLTWNQPPGYQSTLYSSTDLNGYWSPLGVVNPPYAVAPTNPVVFFYVTVAPTNVANPMVVYSNNPNMEGLRPAFTNQPAVAYDMAGEFGFYGWSVTEQLWK